MTEIKLDQRLFIVPIVTGLAGCLGAVAFEVGLEFDRFDIVPRDYALKLWVCDIAFLFGMLAAVAFGYWAWKDSDMFRDLIVIDFAGWVRGIFTSR